MQAGRRAASRGVETGFAAKVLEEMEKGQLRVAAAGSPASTPSIAS
jgi:hypothetical protein